MALALCADLLNQVLLGVLLLVAASLSAALASRDTLGIRLSTGVYGFLVQILGFLALVAWWLITRTGRAEFLLRPLPQFLPVYHIMLLGSAIALAIDGSACWNVRPRPLARLYVSSRVHAKPLLSLREISTSWSPPAGSRLPRPPLPLRRFLSRTCIPRSISGAEHRRGGSAFGSTRASPSSGPPSLGVVAWIQTIECHLPRGARAYICRAAPRLGQPFTLGVSR